MLGMAADLGRLRVKQAVIESMRDLRQDGPRASQPPLRGATFLSIDEFDDACALLRVGLGELLVFDSAGIDVLARHGAQVGCRADR